MAWVTSKSIVKFEYRANAYWFPSSFPIIISWLECLPRYYYFYSVVYSFCHSFLLRGKGHNFLSAISKRGHAQLAIAMKSSLDCSPFAHVGDR